MSQVQRHYEEHLADVYSWIYGEFAPRVRANHDFFETHSIAGPGTAIDLGAGPGYQSIPLTDLGFSVVAVDFSAKLLDELHERAGQRNIRSVQSDILDFESWRGRSPSLIVCMGDTLTHLPSREAVSELLDVCGAELGTGSTLAFTFRHIAGERGDVNFVPVRSADERIFTCVLVHEEDRVLVSDLLHEKDGEAWTQKVSSYYKLKIEPAQLDREIVARGFETRHFVTKNGLVEGIWRKV